jgi:uncharacterized protein
MTEEINIKSFPLDENGLEMINFEGEASSLHWSNNWPVVYILSNYDEAYVGETYKVKERIKQHQKNNERLKLTKISILIDKQANKSYTLDIEANLIRHMSVDGLFKLQNENKGLVNYEYFNRELYKKRFAEIIWPKLQEFKLAKRSLREIQNDDLFKYSPYTPLAINQFEIVTKILSDLSKPNNSKLSIIIKGSAGTGKTVLGTYLMKLLTSNEDTYEEKETESELKKVQTHIKKIALVIPQQSLRKTLKRVFRKIKGLNSNMVLSPNDVTKDKFDLLIVDEAHRLRQRKNLSSYNYFDNNNRNLGLHKEATELDWIIKQSKNQIFFFDKDQSIKPTDITFNHFNNQIKDHIIIEHQLLSQFRVIAGENYISYIKDILDCNVKEKKSFANYELKIFDDIIELKNAIIQKNHALKLCRLVAGYGWKWNTRHKKSTYDIDIKGHKFIWNTTSEDWVTSENSINEVGCIHTIQGYDLNIAGVILGPEITYDENEKKIKVITNNYYDINGKKGIKDNAEIERYVKNIYGVLLTRGILGTYIYVCDDKLRNYLKKWI